MADFTYGPVDLIAASFEGDLPDPSVLAVLGELVDAGQLRVLDLLVVRRDEDGELSFDDLDLTAPPFAGSASIELVAPGLVAAEDAAALVDDLAPGSAATVVALELTWATRLASQLAAVGGVTLETVRIPAPVVNAVLEAVTGR
jgi:hypothetical protein